MKRGIDDTEVDVTADMLGQMRMEAFSAAEDQIMKLGMRDMEEACEELATVGLEDFIEKVQADMNTKTMHGILLRILQVDANSNSQDILEAMRGCDASILTKETFEHMRREWDKTPPDGAKDWVDYFERQGKSSCCVSTWLDGVFSCLHSKYAS